MSQGAHPAQPHRVRAVAPVRFKEPAAQTGRTMYQLKHGLLDDYLIQQLRNPSLRMALA
jgi:hypothetical protein